MEAVQRQFPSRLGPQTSAEEAQRLYVLVYPFVRLFIFIFFFGFSP